MHVNISSKYLTCTLQSQTKLLRGLISPTPPRKLNLGLQIDGRLLIANHLDQSLWLANQKQGAAIKSYVLHFSLAGVGFAIPFYQPQQTVQKCLVSLTGMFDFSSSNFNLQGQILNTGRIALTATIEIVVYKRSIVTARSNLGGTTNLLEKIWKR